MKVSAQAVRLHDARSYKLRFWAAALGSFTITAASCNAVTPTEDTTGPIWPTKEWQISSPEKEGMDSRALAKLVDWGTAHSLDSVLVARHGRIVLEGYYAPYTAGSLHQVYSVTKSVVSTLVAIAWKDGLLDSLNHRVLDFFDRRSLANVDERKESITVQNLLDMTSGFEWTEQVGSIIPPIETDREMAVSVDWVKFILDLPMSCAPGGSFNYDSGNPHLLSAILTKLAGSNTLEYAKAKLFGPLGIKEVKWSLDPQGVPNGGWGLWLLPRDMLKIGYLYLRKGVWEGKQLLPTDWANNVSHGTVDTHLNHWFRYSDLFWVLPDKAVYAAIGRYGQAIMVFPDLDVVAVTTSRTAYPSYELADCISDSVK